MNARPWSGGTSRTMVQSSCRVLLVYAVLATATLRLPAAEATKAVPPEGVAPFDPKPLMEKVAERITMDKYRFAVIGDTKHAKTFPALTKYMEEELKPDFVIFTGDFVQAGGGKCGPKNWAKLAKESGASLRARPWWPVIGNHELAGTPTKKKHDDELDDDEPLSTDGLENFKRFFNLDQEYYSFSFRNAVFVVLPWPLPKGASEKWLKEELLKASATGKHIFICNHLPFYTVGGKSKRDIPNKETDITKLFQKHGVCAVFSGHDHTYYRTIRNGIPYIISAGGGAKLYAVARKDEALPGDVYYGVEPAGMLDILAKKRYLYHNGAAGWPDKLTEQPDQYVVIVDVDGPKVTMFTVTAKGEKWDGLELSRK